jgi:hypothetical protein
MGKHFVPKGLAPGSTEALRSYVAQGDMTVDERGVGPAMSLVRASGTKYLTDIARYFIPKALDPGGKCHGRQLI